MTQFDASMDRDANRVPLTGDFPFRTKRTITFAGVHGATNDKWGDDGGALKDGVVFTVTGVVIAKCLAAITTSLGGANSTLELGITGATAIFMPTETCTDMGAGQIWMNDAFNVTYMDIGLESAAAGNFPEYVLNGNDIILSTKTDEITSGVIDFYCLWKPISDDASVVATTT